MAPVLRVRGGEIAVRVAHSAGDTTKSMTAWKASNDRNSAQTGKLAWLGNSRYPTGYTPVMEFARKPFSGNANFPFTGRIAVKPGDVVSNQWGRDSQSVSARGASSASAVLALVLGLALGGGAGYGYLRYMSGDTAVRLATVEQRNSELAGELADTRQKLGQALAAQQKGEAGIGSAEGEAAELQKKLDLQRSELDAMAEEVARISDALQSEKDRSNRLSQELDGERNKVRSQATAIAEAEKNATASRAEADAAIADLQARMAAQQGNGQREVDRLRGEEIPRLNRQIAELADKVAANEADAAKFQSQRQSLEKALEGARADVVGLKASLETERQKNAALTADMQRLERDAVSPSAATESQSSPAATEKPSTEEAARDAALVYKVLAGTPGIDRLTSENRQRLRDMLVSGQCVTTGLRAVFPSVPVVTLRNLMRDLKSEC
ncbi:MAG: hypothetical protein DI528_08600 [Shinella sp.]|nr:MAG: hypothetical protein DI528_08600 [Shinella sp.]